MQVSMELLSRFQVCCVAELVVGVEGEVPHFVVHQLNCDGIVGVETSVLAATHGIGGEQGSLECSEHFFL